MRAAVPGASDCIRWHVRPLKLLLVTPAYARDGSEADTEAARRADLVDTLALRGHQATVITSSPGVSGKLGAAKVIRTFGGDYWWAGAVEAGGEAPGMWARLGAAVLKIGLWRALAATLRQESFDVVHALRLFPAAGICLRQARRRQRLGEAALKAVELSYSVDGVAARLERLYGEAVERHRERASRR